MSRHFTWLLIGFALCVNSLSQAFEVFSSRHLYDWGYYGLYPQTTFKSFELKVPRLNFVKWDELHCSEGHYLIAPKGKIVSHPGPVIVDARGELVWASHSYGIVTDLRVQEFNGEHYLTFWSGPHGTSNGYGRGLYYMLDSSYEVFRTFEPVGEGLMGDLHEFHITKDGTVLMTAYNPVPADLTSLGGPSKGWALDGIFQEIDIASGDLLFEWSSMQHVALNDTVRYFMGADDGTTPRSAFDYFHINSIDKDGDGNYVVSGRHTQTIMGISGKPEDQGAVLWTLGGRHNQFKDLSDGHATDFTYQHHVRLHENRTLSIFDNANAERWGPATPYDYSRGIMIRLDTQKMTATLLEEYFDPDHPHHPSSQGSMQVMNDRVVVDYGFLPRITDFARDTGNNVLCEAEIAPWLVARWGLVTSYRAFKTKDWVGRPKEAPGVFLKPSEGSLYVSWNGATEVDRWVLQGAEWDELKEEIYHELTVVKRERFETAFEIEGTVPQYLRVAAVDKRGNVIAHTEVLNSWKGNAQSTLVCDILTVAAVLASICIVVGILARKRGLRGIKNRSRELLASLGRRLLGLNRRSAPGGVSYPETYTPMKWWRDWRRPRAQYTELVPLYNDE
ncbi:Arylsulfotransferase-domain-containing protein [Xylariomycetidae sp. FL2044]|nr:Arylsulfotransferase-domain-containing protein [Xylariomycetidae sp. FL2044]